MIRFCFLCLGCITYIALTGESISANQRTVTTGKPAWRIYDATDGLPGVDVRDIHQDHNNHIWVITESGAGKFDSQKWINYSTEDGLGHNSIWAMEQDNEQNYWFATWEGITRFDGDNWQTFMPSQNDSIQNLARTVYKDQTGRIWAGLRGGLAVFENQNWQTFTTSNFLPEAALVSVWSILEDKNKNIWAATVEGVGRYNNGWKTYSHEQGLVDKRVHTIIQDQNDQLWFGTEGGVSQYDGQKWINYTDADALTHNLTWTLYEDPTGTIWAGSFGGGVNYYKNGTWQNYTIEQGLSGNYVRSIFQDHENNIWFGTEGSGLCQLLDGVTQYGQEDGIADPRINFGAAFVDAQNNIWFGTAKGLNKFDGQSWTTYTTKDGLPDNDIYAIHQDKKGHFWIGTYAGGLAHFDGTTWHHYSMADGLPSNRIFAIQEDDTGLIWAATYKGLISFDGANWKTYSVESNHVPDNYIRAIHYDRNGVLWIGTAGGLTQFDGTNWKTFNKTNSPIKDPILCIKQDQSDHIWLGTTHGVIKIENGNYRFFTNKNGLSGNRVYTLMQDKEGQMWFGTRGGGITKFDGHVFQTLNEQDGLPHNSINAMVEDQTNTIWVGTEEGGVVCYRPTPKTPPHIQIKVGDNDSPENPLTLPATTNSIQITLEGISFKTRPGGLLFRYQLKGHDTDWIVTRNNQVTYQNLSEGNYEFLAQAIDRDLVYSSVQAKMPIYIYTPLLTQIMYPAFCLLLPSFIFLSLYAIKKRKELRNTERMLLAEMHKELQTAHDLQMNLMPTTRPQIDRLDLAGRCLPANHVGGDYFQYFQYQNKLALTMADVTGHAMEAAIPVVMFSGILESQIEQGGTLTNLLERLNHTLTRTFTGRTFVCFAMAEIDIQTLQVHLSNGACPYPYHYIAKNKQIIEIEMDAYPLGLRNDTEFPETVIQLNEGDYLVFCSDGIAEAIDINEEFFGYDQLQHVIYQACQQGHASEVVIDQIIKSVTDFVGEMPQNDDMTCMVLRVNST